MATKNKTFRRSPAYPSISLRRAVGLARIFEDKVGRNKAGAADAIKVMGLTPTGSKGQRALAALVSYGILLSEGKSTERVVWLSELGLDLVHLAEGSSEHVKALQTTALNPSIHAWAKKRWPDSLPDDQLIQSALKRSLNFNTGSIRSFVGELRDTFAYAQIDSGVRSEDHTSELQ